MMDNYIKITEYLELCKEKKNFYLFFTICLFCLIFLCLMIKIENNYQTEGYILDNMVVININVNDLEKINHGDYVFIENKKYKYKIYDYEEEITSLGEIYYKKIRIMINLEEKINQDYNVIKLKFILEKKPFFKLIMEKMKNQEAL